MKYRTHWNWQQADWPDFRFERSKLDALEAEFLQQSGVFSGCIRHIAEDDREALPKAAGFRTTRARGGHLG